jgi:small subunit ribosomal protein S6
MAYEINHRTEADYRWMRFEAPSDLLDTLDHNLKIADGVLRFRIFKVDPDAPVIVPPAATAAPGPRERSAQGAREDRGDSGDDSDE